MPQRGLGFKRLGVWGGCQVLGSRLGVLGVYSLQGFKGLELKRFKVEGFVVYVWFTVCKV